MKIKCPSCKTKMDQHLLAEHLNTYHSDLERFVMLRDLLVKIHEKIELYNNFETSKSPKSLNYAIVVILKSLLENEKS